MIWLEGHKMSFREAKCYLRRAKARALEVDERHLQWLDYCNYGKHGKMFMWNCVDPTHIKYKSTVAAVVRRNGDVILG